MGEEERKVEQELMPWRFWFSLTLTAFLVVTFGFYLPLRFQHMGVVERHAELGMEMAQDHQAARYHEEGEVREGLVVNLNVTPTPIAAGASARLDFFVNQKPGSVPVTDLEIEHEKLMHVIGVRSDMNEFFHIHPVRNQTPEASAVPPQAERISNGVHPQPFALELSGFFTAIHRFERPGLYKVWSEVKKGGINHAFGHPELRVEGFGTRSEKQVSFGRNVIAGNYQVGLRLEEPVVKGHEHDLSFDVHTLTGQEVETEDWLGAKMHLAVIKDDWKQFIHTHPEEGEDHHGVLHMVSYAEAHGSEEETPGAVSGIGDETINFHVTFAEAGLYKVFAQFRPRGTFLSEDEAFTAAFWVKVEEQAPAVFSAWWRNLLVSAGAIAALSIFVKKLLAPKEA